MKYRIVTAPETFLGLFTIFDLQETRYAVQARIPFIPIWFKVTRYYKTENQAKEYIKLILDVKGN